MTLDFEQSLQWWLSPLSSASTHHLDIWIVWHARLMVFAWAILLPVGAIAARYYKVTPKQDWPHVVDNRAWWHAHRILQYGGVALMLIGGVLAWNKGSGSTYTALIHAYLGWSVITLGVVQVIGAWLRGSKGGPTDAQLRGDHYDMTPHRLRFEAIHKTCGWLALVLAVLTVVLGLVAADAPRWMAGVLVVWWAALVILGVRLEREGRCIDTYQAIWGTDPSHPGNQRPKIAWAMRRPHNEQERS